MLKWLRSKLGRGLKAIELPEAKNEDMRTLYLGRFSPEGELGWRFSRPTHVIAVLKRYGKTVVELQVKKDLIGTPLVDQILRKLEARFTVPPIEWVDHV